MEPGSIIELRLPKTERDGTVSGYFSDPQHLVDAARNARGPGVYVTLNRIPTDLLARADNRVKTRVRETTSDKEVTRRLKLLLDFDPPRAAGISATDAEHDAAIDAARAARAALNWPAPVLADSGNGGHLIYAIDLPNDEETTALIKLVLKAAAQRFNTPRVQVDTSVFNASRISKLYGTVAAKGDSTADRPHRLSRILEMPDTLEPVPLELLKALASEVYQEPPPVAQFQSNQSSFSLESFLSQHGVQVRVGPVFNNGSEMWRLEECPFDPAHGIDATLFRRPNGALAFKCFHDGCADKRWQDFRAHYEPNRPTYEPKHRKSQTFTNGHASNAAPVLADEPQAAQEPEQLNDYLAILTAETARITAAKDLSDSTGAYSPSFITLCVQAGHIAAFTTRQLLKKAFGKDLVLKGFPGAWDNRYQLAVDNSRRQSTGPHIPSWRDQLILTEKGHVAACYENAALHAENSPEWAGVLGYNEFTGGHVVMEQGPYPLTAKPGEEIEDHFDTEVTRWFERQGVMVKPEVARRTVDRMARMNAFHPVRDYLNGLPAWDGQPRAADWLIQYCRVSPTVKDENDVEAQNLFAMDIGQRFLISAIARIIEPGCKADHVLMLEGKTGIGKSTLCEVLVGNKDFFTDQLSDLGSKDASMQVRGIWMAELADIHALSRSDRERAKAFITQRFERFRLPYGKRLVKFSRQCVFIGTTESSEWNTDERGARRFWPVLCEGKIDIDGIIRDRDQLWAEALYQYRRGHKWHIVQPEVLQAAEQVQDSRYAVDVWQQHVISAAEELCLGSLGSASISDILTKLKVPVERQDKAQANRVGACLRFAKWDRRQVRSANGREYRYFAPVTIALA